MKPRIKDIPGRFAFLANGPRACERRNGVDEVGVVLQTNVNIVNIVHISMMRGNVNKTRCDMFNDKKTHNLGKRYELGYLSSVPVVLTQPESATSCEV